MTSCRTANCFMPLRRWAKAMLSMKKLCTQMHKENKRLLTEPEIADWVASQGIDRNTFLATYRSFAVISKARAAKQMAEAYRIDGVPTIVMQGKYVTSPSIAGTKAKAILVMDYLEEKIRKNKYKQ